MGEAAPSESRREAPRANGSPDVAAVAIHGDEAGEPLIAAPQRGVGLGPRPQRTRAAGGEARQGKRRDHGPAFENERRCACISRESHHPMVTRANWVRNWAERRWWWNARGRFGSLPG